MPVKILHYCWFGGNELPEATKKYIESWKKYCPDFELMLWNESNFDVRSVPFTEEAYNSKKWAFVADYVRFYALYTYGGLYVDTDVEFVKGIDDLLDTSFMGYERHNVVAPGLILYAEKPGVEVYSKMLDIYKGLHFSTDNMDNITSPVLLTELVKGMGLKCDNTLQKIDDFVVYPMEYFNPKGEHIASEPVITPNTRTIHHYDASWFTDIEKTYFEYKKKYGEFFGRLFFSLRHPVAAAKRVRRKK